MTTSRLSKMEDESLSGIVGDLFGSIPEGFLADALSLTTPRDACRLSSVSSLFRSAAEWDAVWETFLPSDYETILTQSVADGGFSINFSSKKQLYFRLCDHPIIIDGGNKSFSLDKRTGKKCYMLGARDLSIIWGDTPRYWRWISLPQARFTEVAELLHVCWLEVHGRISASMLSPNTVYVALIVFKTTSKSHGFNYQPVEVSIGISGVERQTRTVFLDPEERVGCMPKEREDGWLEIEVGEYFTKEEDEDEEVEVSMTEVKMRYWKGGIVIQGIEIRPKHCVNM